MPTTEKQTMTNWWASGDTPVRTDSRITYLIDGRTALLAMCCHFFKAHNYIYLANWGMTPTMEIVRGKDQCAGPDGSPAQEALIEELRAEGLQEADIAFWCTHKLSLQAVLGYAVSKGVEVKVLLWHCPEAFAHFSPKTAQKELTPVGVTCILDDSTLGGFGIIHHPAESLHQKISIVDGTHAFVGGVDPLIESNGDYDRWDTPAHLFSSPLRQTQEDSHHSHPWHDAHALIEGPAAGDVELNFRQRWNDVVKRHHWDVEQSQGMPLLIPEHPLAPPVEPLQGPVGTPLVDTQVQMPFADTQVQVARTIPEHTYSFDPATGIQGIAQLYANAVSNIQHFLYLENQYFWLRAYTGIDIPFLGGESPDMAYNIRKLGEALQRGATVAIVLPDHPNVGRAFTDAGIALLRKEAPEAIAQGRLQVFCLGTSTRQEDGEHYRPIYVHAKVAIVDDLWATVGSGNLNNRGMRDDTEMNIATLNVELAYSLRLMLWAEHLGLLSDDELFALARYVGHQQQRAEERAQALSMWQHLHETLSDPLVGLRLMTERAQDNLRRYKAKQPLVGHLLPYLLAEEAAQQGVSFHEEHGWVEEP